MGSFTVTPSIPKSNLNSCWILGWGVAGYCIGNLDSSVPNQDLDWCHSMSWNVEEPSLVHVNSVAYEFARVAISQWAHVWQYITQIPSNPIVGHIRKCLL